MQICQDSFHCYNCNKEEKSGLSAPSSLPSHFDCKYVQAIFRTSRRNFIYHWWSCLCRKSWQPMDPYIQEQYTNYTAGRNQNSACLFCVSQEIHCPEAKRSCNRENRSYSDLSQLHGNACHSCWVLEVLLLRCPVKMELQLWVLLCFPGNMGVDTHGRGGVHWVYIPQVHYSVSYNKILGRITSFVKPLNV